MELITSNTSTIVPLPNFKKAILGTPSMFLSNGTILTCGGENNDKKCIRLQGGSWVDYNSLNLPRANAASVSTATTNFIFGGLYSPYTYEYLEENSHEWVFGEPSIPIRFIFGCAVAISQDEIWLIGGSKDGGPINDILSLNVSSQTFTIMSIELLKDGRRNHQCTKIPGTRSIIVTGGYNKNGLSNTTEIIDIENKSVIELGSMNFIRADHGIGILKIENHDRVVVFGGKNNEDATRLKNFEFFNTLTAKWEMSNIELSAAKSEFGFLTI